MKRTPVTEQTFHMHDVETLKAELNRCKRGGKKWQALKDEIAMRKPDGSRMTLAEYALS